MHRLRARRRGFILGWQSRLRAFGSLNFMRGIAGIIRFGQGPVDPAEIRRLIDTMAICPTDRIATWCEGSAGLAHLIKFVQPEDRFEAQPLHSVDGNLVLVTDALLENRAELAAEFGFPAHELPTLPDSMFVLRAYEKWGEDCPNHLEGRFTFAVWHVREQRLFCAVDHFALRPFYYFHRGAVFAFATTLRGLLSLPNVSRRLNEGVLVDFLFYTQTEPRDRALYADISVLPAAHRLSATAGSVYSTRYWEPDCVRSLKLRSTADYVAAFAAEFERAVSVGLRVNGDIGVTVSGGLDSSAVAVVAGQFLARQGKRLQAIHWIPASADPRRKRLLEHDESRYVRLLQQHAAHIDFHFLPRRQSAIALAGWDAILEQHCVPISGFAFEKPASGDDFPAVARMLSGLGGNFIVSTESETSSYLAQLAITLRWLRLIREFRGQRRVYGRSLREIGRNQLFAAFVRQRPAPNSRLRLQQFLNPDFIRRAAVPDRIERSIPRFLRPEAFSVSRQRLRAMREILPQHIGAAPSVIGTNHRADGYHPMFNRRLNEFCLSVSPGTQFENGWDRLLLRRAMKSLLPEALAWRVTRGFPFPGAWQPALELQSILPVALDTMALASTPGAYLDLTQIRRHLASPGYLQTGQLGLPQFINLFNVGWFLRWNEGRFAQTPS